MLPPTSNPVDKMLRHPGVLGDLPRRAAFREQYRDGVPAPLGQIDAASLLQLDDAVGTHVLHPLGDALGDGDVGEFTASRRTAAGAVSVDAVVEFDLARH